MSVFLKFILTLSILSFQVVFGQDERYFREHLSGELGRLEKAKSEEPDFLALSSVYEVNLAGNELYERLIFESRDGREWFTVYDAYRKKVFEYPLKTLGMNSRVYKIRLLQINDRERLLILYHFEGSTDYLELNAHTRLHFITYDVSDLGTMKGHKGPLIWEEFSNKRGHYRRRSYDVRVFDLDQSGTKEVIVNYQDLKRIYRYLGKGSWEEI